MKAWGRRTWQCMWGEITCLRTPTGSCIARALRTWKTDCKAITPLSTCRASQCWTTQHELCSLFATGTSCLKERRVRMLVACWGNGTWSSLGRCSTPCTPCSALHQATVWHTPSTHHLTATTTISATSSSWVVWWLRQSMITGYWSATSPAASTSTSWARVSGIWATVSHSQVPSCSGHSATPKRPTNQATISTILND